MRIFLVFLSFCTSLLAAENALSEPLPTVVKIMIKDHKFVPDTVSIPSGELIRVEIRNQDGTAEEFDSDDLHVEKDISPHGKIVFSFGPLQPGVYHFVGELHANSAQGEFIVVTTPTV